MLNQDRNHGISNTKDVDWQTKTYCTIDKCTEGQRAVFICVPDGVMCDGKHESHYNQNRTPVTK